MYGPRPIRFIRTLVCGLFKIPGFSGSRYFKRLDPTPFFNLVPRAFPLKKNGWGATHFLREKPWGRGCPFFGSRLRRQNFYRAPRQYRQLRRLQVITLYIMIIPLFTLGSIYSTCASGAEQMPETNNSN